MSDRAQPPLRLAVVGGGVSGLTAAHRLRQLLPAAELTLFEAAARLGGPLHTERSGGLILERGADSFTTKIPWAADLCRQLGLADELVATNQQFRRAMVVRAGKLLAVPAGFVIMQPRQWGPLLRSPLLSLAGKARALAEPWISTPPAARVPGYDESVASFATRRFGREMFERLVEPLMAGIYVADAAELSLAATMPEFLEAERTHGSLRRAARASTNGAASTPSVQTPAASGARYESFVTLRRGMSSLIDAIANSLPPRSLRLNAPVVELSKGAGHRWRLTTAEQLPEQFDGVVLATPAPRAAPLVERLDPQLANLLGRIAYASSVVVTHVYPREAFSRPLEAFGFVVPRVEQRSLVAASFPSVKFPGRAPTELVPIRAFLGGALHPDIAGESDDHLAALAHRELHDLLHLAAEPVETHVARWPESMPQYRVGHVQMAEAIQHLAGAHRGLAFAGNAYRGVGIPQCIRSGQEAAERVARSIAAAS
jgi:oxygen-dependent protoporphyrinogen oxidase